MIRRKDQMLEESNSHFTNSNSEGNGSREVVYVYSSPRVKKEPVDEDSEDVQATELAGRKGTIQVPKPRYYYYAYQSEKGNSRVQSSKAKPEGDQGQGDTCNQDSPDHKIDEIHDSRYWPPSIRDRDGHTKPAYIVCDQNGEPNAYHMPSNTRGKHKYIYPSVEYRQRSPRRSPEHGNHSPFEVLKPFEEATVTRHSPDWKEEEYRLDLDRKDGIKIQNEGQPAIHLRKSGEQKVRKEQTREPYVVVHPGSYYYPEDDLPPDVPYRYERREYVYRQDTQNERYSPVRVVHTRDLAGKNYKLHQRIPETKPGHPGYNQPPSKRPSETSKAMAESSNKEHSQNNFQGEYHGEYYNPPNVTLINRPESGDYVMYSGQDVEYSRHHNRSTPSTEDENQSGNEVDPHAAAIPHHRSSVDNKGDNINRSSADNKGDNKSRHFELSSEGENESTLLTGPRGEREHRFIATPTGARREHYGPRSPLSRRYSEPYMIYPGKIRPPGPEGTKRKYHEVYDRNRDYHGPSKVFVQNEEYRPRRCVVYQVPAYPGCCCPCCPCATVPRPEQARPPPPPPPPPTIHPTHARVSPRPVPPQRPNPPLPQSPPTNSMITYPRRRRNRTVYTNDQIVELEEVFKIRHYLDVDEKSSLAGKLKVRTENVEIWFKNRRAKWRREMKALKSGGPEDGESDDSTVDEGIKEEDDQISNKDYPREGHDAENNADLSDSPLIKIEMKEVTEDNYESYTKKEPHDFQENTEFDTSSKE